MIFQVMTQEKFSSFVQVRAYIFWPLSGDYVATQLQHMVL
jgi:hypothetical protein